MNGRKDTKRKEERAALRHEWARQREQIRQQSAPWWGRGNDERPKHAPTRL